MFIKRRVPSHCFCFFKGLYVLSKVNRCKGNCCCNLCNAQRRTALERRDVIKRYLVCDSFVNQYIAKNMAAENEQNYFM